MTPPSTLAAAFRAAFGSDPAGFVFASGRVNLIGEHLDYNGGMVLPMPISTGTWIAWSPRSDGRIGAVAADFPGTELNFALGDGTVTPPGHWSCYVQGMAESCHSRGMAIPGTNLCIAGTMPRGAGLSSSASLCIALGRAWAAAAGVAQPDQQGLALAAQATEHGYAGVRCGIMDQMAIAHASPGEALALDCASHAFRQIAIPADWAVLIAESGVERGLVEGEYNARRQDCETAAAALGSAPLAQVSLAELDRAGLPETVHRRARHVITEQARTRAAIAALEACDLKQFGRLMEESHASLRDDFAVSVAPVDQLAALLNAAIGEAGGARMTGGGFGGAVVAVLHQGRLDEVRRALLAGYQTPAGTPPRVIVEQGFPARS